jgi:hypothetical protein
MVRTNLPGAPLSYVRCTCVLLNQRMRKFIEDDSSQVPEVPDSDSTILTTSNQPFTFTVEGNGSDIHGMSIETSQLPMQASIHGLRRWTRHPLGWKMRWLFRKCTLFCGSPRLEDVC